MRKIYVLPNMVTSLNLFCGFYSIVLSLEADFENAAWAIIAASIFDMLDGRIARMTNATSPFGTQYDSICDVVSFGVAPAILMYSWALGPFERLGILAAFLFTCCGALRLARFNVTIARVPDGYFMGLPIPMAALIVSTFVIFNYSTGWVDETSIPVLIVSFGLPFLMVSRLLFPSFKDLGWKQKGTLWYIFAIVLGIILVAIRPEVALFLLAVCYVSGSILWNVARYFKKRTRGSVRAGSIKPQMRQ